MPDEIGINDVAEAQRWANIHHRMLCSDIGHINELYERVAWLAKPWWRRLGRKPPWFRATRLIDGTTASSPLAPASGDE